jgi:hypothetical protein
MLKLLCAGRLNQCDDILLAIAKLPAEETELLHGFAGRLIVWKSLALRFAGWH